MFIIILALLFSVTGIPSFAQAEDSSLKASAVAIPGCKDPAQVAANAAAADLIEF